MNSHQFSLYATDSDFDAIWERIAALGSPFTVLDSRTRPKEEAQPCKSRFLALARNDDVPDLVREPLHNGDELLQILQSPAIEVNRPFFDGSEMSLGRFYYVGRCYRDGRLTEKSVEFLNWARSVFRVVKMGLTYDKQVEAYWGAGAKSWIKQSACYEIGPARRIIARSKPDSGPKTCEPNSRT